jgi:hypothetical protein
MLVSTYFPLIAMGFHVVLFYYSAGLITLLAFHSHRFAARLANVDFLAGRDLCVVYRTLEILSP